MSFITAEGVSFSWGQARILQEVSLCAGKGKFVGVIGPNGSGKSTLLKCIYRVLHQDAGCIFWMERKIQKGAIRKRRVSWALWRSTTSMISIFPSGISC